MCCNPSLKPCCGTMCSHLLDHGLRVLVEMCCAHLAGSGIAQPLAATVVQRLATRLISEGAVAGQLPAPQAAQLVRLAVVLCGHWIVTANRCLCKRQHGCAVRGVHREGLLLVVLESAQAAVDLPAPHLQDKNGTKDGAQHNKCAMCSVHSWLPAVRPGHTFKLESTTELGGNGGMEHMGVWIQLDGTKSGYHRAWPSLVLKTQEELSAALQPHRCELRSGVLVLAAAGQHQGQDRRDSRVVSSARMQQLLCESRCGVLAGKFDAAHLAALSRQGPPQTRSARSQGWQGSAAVLPGESLQDLSALPEEPS